VRFREGDIIILQGELDAMPEILDEMGCLPLAERNLQLGRRGYVFLPPAILIGAVLLTMFNILPVSIAFMAGAAMIAILRIMKLNEIYESIDWPILILLGALIPVTSAMETTGMADLMAAKLADYSQGLSPAAIITLVLTTTLIVTPFLNNAATVLLMAPIAAGLAMKSGLNVDPLLMAVAVGASCDFLTPVGHQSNTLVMGPGGYKFTDYWRLGLPLSILVIVLGVPAIMWAWPVH
jgi:di/tricarboxylate transporter